MPFRGFTRQLQRRGGWFERLAIGHNDAPVFPPLHIGPSAAPTGTAQEGDIYVDTNGTLHVHNGTNFVPGGGGNITVTHNYTAASVDTYAFIADRAYAVVNVRAIPTVIGSDGGTVTADVRKCINPTAPNLGVTVLAATINLKGTANTVQSPALSSTAADLLLATGNRLSVDFSGTLTAAVGLIQITLRPI